MLFSFTQIVNFLALLAALWLGLYVVTRSPRRLLSWLTGLTLWAIAGLFLNVLLALNPPPTPAYFPAWLRLFLPFWPAGTLETGANDWLQGWSVTLAIVLWHHVTILMRPGRLNLWRWTRVIFGYLLAAIAIIVQAYTPFFFSSVAGDPLYLNTLKAGPLYMFFLACLLLYTGMSLVNLLRSARAAPAAMPRKQLIILSAATLIAGLAGPLAIVGSALGLPVPMVTLSVLLGIAVVLIGYGVARYSALMEGRTIRRDFFYNAFAIGLVTGLYAAITWLSGRIYDVPAVAFVFVVMLAIVTHSVVDVARHTLDPIFYRRDNRQLRRSLRQLASLVGEQDVDESLHLALDSMCASVRATYGLICLFEGEKLQKAAACHWGGGTVPLGPGDLAADDVRRLDPGEFPPPLTEAALLIPLYADMEQSGAVILGRPVNGIHYSQTDVDLLLYPSDRLASIIRDAQREAAYLARVAQLTSARRTRAGTHTGRVPVKVVEDALRNLSSYAHLGDTPLVELNLVHVRFPEGAVTHLDRGKVVYSVISEAVEKLRPDSGRPGDPVPREWHPYLILHGAYVEDRLNRDIMSRLYISEGTFNRTRRSAIRSVARVLGEMEAALH